ncbi:helix-turn-helix domain-containing protein [Grimontia sp. S25]|uniref:Helix-turn-helix domain-containing protein n=1 Tax=Grimontia sedimenti TaxID=2711294 RepID=A0A6M1RF76_9GAMM|nr:AraC family transcriptional regulator [Grimontia sedimenti]NGN96239.1 helix-turn-helix domain-containing protein [Grimontia sedimenti]
MEDKMDFNNIKNTSNERYQSIHCAPIPLANSKPLNEIKEKITYASTINIPILISGEPGTEKRTIAKLVHEINQNSKGKIIFLPSYARTSNGFKSVLDEGIQAARNGTLVLSDVDSLTEEHKDFLTYVLANNDIYRRLEDSNIQLVVSTSEKSSNRSDILREALGGCMAHLELSIPPLSERPEDIFYYIDNFIDFYKGSNNLTLSDDAKALLYAYSWPGNVNELRNVVVQLISLKKSYICRDDVENLKLHEKKKTTLIESLYNKDISQFQKLHPSLYKSLVFISENFLEEITLEKIANNAFSSPSHLSYLFRSNLHASFKNILVELRILHAKTLIHNRPSLKITEVCMQSGFGDLSHFEKMFKRHTGSSPRVYRNIYREKNIASITQ